MTEAFDPYRKWLGIPPEEQPPNHYRLLGIAVYEDDPDVIENAADRQMSHVRTFQNGRNAEASQRLLNELSAARLTLLTADRKQEYDASLRAAATPPKAAAAAPPPPRPLAAPPVAPPRPVESPAGVVAPVVTAAATPVVSPVVSPVGVAAGKRTSPTRMVAARRKQSLAPLLIGGGLAAVGVIVLLIVLVSMTNDTPDTATRGGESNPVSGRSLSDYRQPGVTPAGPTTTPTPSSPAAPIALPELPLPTEVADEPESSGRGDSPGRFPGDGSRYGRGRSGSFPGGPFGTGRGRSPSDSRGAPAEPTAPSAATVRQSFEQVRALIGERRLSDATRELGELETIASQFDLQEEHEHLRTLTSFQRTFWESVRNGVRRNLEPGASFTVLDQEVRLIERHDVEGEVSYHTAGGDHRAKIDDLPADHAILFALRPVGREEIDPFALVYAGTFLLLDRQDESASLRQRGRAAEFWQLAVAAGIENKYFAAELGIELAAASVAPSLPLPPASAENAPATAPTPTTPSVVAAPPATETTPPANGPQPIPADDQLQLARGQVTRNLSRTPLQSVPPPQREEFLNGVVRQAERSPHAPFQYAMFQAAADIAAGWGRARLLVEIVDRWAAAFAIDRDAELEARWLQIKPSGEAERKEFIEVGEVLVEAARARGDDDTARRLFESGLKAAIESGAAEIEAGLRGRLRQLEERFRPR